MHLDKLIELFEKNVLLYGHAIERATLEHLRELRAIKEKGTKPKREPKAQIAPIKQYAFEPGVNPRVIQGAIEWDESSPKPVGETTIRNRMLLHYDRDEFYAWWNNRKKSKNSGDSL